MERWVCAPQSEPGGMESDPKESDSVRVGSDLMASSFAVGVSSVDGRIDWRIPGVNVDGAKTGFILLLLVVEE